MFIVLFLMLSSGIAGFLISDGIKSSRIKSQHREATQIERMSAALASLKVIHVAGDSDDEKIAAIKMMCDGVTIQEGSMKDEVFQMYVKSDMSELAKLFERRLDMHEHRLVLKLTGPVMEATCLTKIVERFMQL